MSTADYSDYSSNRKMSETTDKVTAIVTAMNSENQCKPQQEVNRTQIT